MYATERAKNGEERLDYIFIDCPPSLGLLTVNAFCAASEVLIPIQCEYYALEGLSQLLKNIEMIQKHLNADLVVSTILLTMYDGRTNLAAQVAAEVREHFPEQVLERRGSPLGAHFGSSQLPADGHDLRPVLHAARFPTWKPQRKSLNARIFHRLQYREPGDRPALPPEGSIHER